MPGPPRTGESNHRAKLTEAEVSQIKAMLNDGMDREDIAAEFKISLPTVSGIRQEHSWSWVEPRIKDKSVHRVAKFPMNCEQCGREFLGKALWQRFCSMDCAQLWHRGPTWMKVMRNAPKTNRS